jgi:Zn-finger nucleic acid-binding protein
MALACPRCTVPLERFERDNAGSRVVLDRCPQCDGVWVDGAALGSVSPHLAEVRVQREQLLAFGQRGSVSCPLCDACAFEVPFFGMLIDFCPECQGIWLDGNERIGLLTELEEPVHEGTYREAALAVKRRVTRCVACHEVTPLTQTYVTSTGLICGRCYEGEASTEADPTALASFGGALDDLASWLEVATNPHCPKCGTAHPRR